MENKKYAYIYGLFDPRDNSLKYVGKTIDLQGRFSDHLRNRKISLKSNWVRFLKSKGMVPAMKVFHVVNLQEHQFWEIFYIAFFRNMGIELLNMTDGGDGVENLSKEGRKKISDAMIGNKNGLGHEKSPEEKIRMRDRNLGKIHSEETKNKISNIKKEFFKNPENKNRVQKKIDDFYGDPEKVEKRSLKLQESKRKYSDEILTKIDNMLKSGIKEMAISRELNIPRTTIQNIKLRGNKYILKVLGEKWYV